MLLLYSIWLCFTLLAIEGANVTSSPQVQNISSIIRSAETEIKNGGEKTVILLPKNGSDATNALKPSSESKHLRGVTNTSGFPDQLLPSTNISTTTVLPKNVSSPAIASVPTTLRGNSTSQNSTNPAPNSTTTSTTTTEIPKKPTITFSLDDQPDLLSKVHEANPPPTNVNKNQQDGSSSSNVAATASPIEPISLQSSETISLSSHKDGRAFIVPMVAIIFIIPLLVILANFVTRQLRDYWSKRKYRRMDYLIEEMYH